MTDDGPSWPGPGTGERGRGSVTPNPRVGAVLVRDGAIVAEGWHKVFGGPHARWNACARRGQRHRCGRGHVVRDARALQPFRQDAAVFAHAPGIRGRAVVIGCLDPIPWRGRGGTAAPGGVAVAVGVRNRNAATPSPISWSSKTWAGPSSPQAGHDPRRPHRHAPGRFGLGERRGLAGPGPCHCAPAPGGHGRRRDALHRHNPGSPTATWPARSGPIPSPWPWWSPAAAGPEAPLFLLTDRRRNWCF